MNKKYSWGIALLACALAVGWLLANPGVARAAADNFYPGAWNFEAVGPTDPTERHTDNLPLSKLAPWPRTDGRYFYSGGYQQTAPGTFVIIDTKDKENPTALSVPVFDPVLSPPPPAGSPVWDDPAFNYTNDPENLKSPCGDWVPYYESINNSDPGDDIDPNAILPTCWDPGWITRTHFTAYGTGKVLVVNAQRRSGSSNYRIGWTGISTWDIHDPRHPTLLGRWNAPYERDSNGVFSRAGGVHHLFYDGRYAYLGSEQAGFENRILQIVDLHDPTNIVPVGQWHVYGQADTEPDLWVQNSSFSNYIYRDASGMLHKHVGLHYVSVVGNIAYLSYHQQGLIILDVRDKTNPVKIGELQYLTPEFQANEPQSDFPSPDHEACNIKNGYPAEVVGAACGNAHSAKPIPGGGGLLAMTDEYFQCPYGHLRIIDVSDPTAPFIVSHQILPPIDGETESRTTDCSKSYIGRGPSTHLPTSLNNNILFIAWYGAGVRAVDITDPNFPQEMGYYQYSIVDSDPNGGMAAYDVIGGPGNLLYSSDSVDGVRVLKFLGIGKSGK
jgi:hypothetical protein